MDERDVQLLRDDLIKLKQELTEGRIALQCPHQPTRAVELDKYGSLSHHICEIREAINSVLTSTDNDVENRGIKLLTSVLLEITSVCSDNQTKEVDIKMSARRPAEASLSNEMHCCVEEAYDALDRCKHMRSCYQKLQTNSSKTDEESVKSSQEIESADTEELGRSIRTVYDNAIQLYNAFFGLNFLEDVDNKQTKDETKTSREYETQFVENVGKIIWSFTAGLSEIKSIISKVKSDLCIEDEWEVAGSVKDGVQMLCDRTAELTKRLKPLQEDLKTSKTIEEKETENKLLLSIYEQTKRDLENLNKEMEKANAENERFSKNNSLLQREVDTLKGDRDKVEALKQDLAMHKASYEQTKRDLENLNKEMEKANAENESFSKNNSLLQREVDTLKGDRDKVEALKQDLAMHKARSEDIDKAYKRVQADLDNVKKENDGLLTRLSQRISADLTLNNPKLVDLSDFNRPTRLAEKYSELYDNEWTDAFQILKTYNQMESTVIGKLLFLLNQAYEYCMECRKMRHTLVSAGILYPHIGKLKCILKNPSKEYQTCCESQNSLSDEELNAIAEIAKRNIAKSGESLKEDFIQTVSKNDWLCTGIKSYIDRCVEICWAMANQNPPILLESSFGSCETFDTKKYRYYKKSGTTYGFIVWPVLYLHKDGPLLSQGVAEPK